MRIFNAEAMEDIDIDVISGDYHVGGYQDILQSDFGEAIKKKYPDAKFDEEWFELGDGFFVELQDGKAHGRGSAKYDYVLGIVLDKQRNVVNITDSYVVRHSVITQYRAKIYDLERDIAKLMSATKIE